MQRLAPTKVASAFQGGALQGNALAITPVSSGLDKLDAVLALGGLPAGRVSEIAGPPSSGKTGLALQLLAEQTRAGKLVAIVDGTGQFYPPAAAAMGIDLSRTLIIAPKALSDESGGKRGLRARTCKDDQAAALARAAEIIARSRSFSMILVDLPQHCKLQRTPARRLCVAAQATGSTILTLSGASGAVEGAAARIEASPCQALGSKARRTQLRIAKGGLGHCPSVEFACKTHRFDGNPPAAVAPVLRRALPGEEAPGARLSPSAFPANAPAANMSAASSEQFWRSSHRRPLPARSAVQSTQRASHQLSAQKGISQ